MNNTIYEMACGGDARAAKVPVPILLVDDHAIWRAGVRSMLEGTEFHVVGEAASSSEAVSLARALQPRLVLLDIRMEGGDGLDALETIKHEHPQMIVVMLTTYENPSYLARAIAGGAAGYLLKGVLRKEMLESLQAVVRGEMLLPPEEMTRVLRTIRPSGKVGNADYTAAFPLSAREQEVLQLLATGLSNREIGLVLYVSENTVKTHVEHIMNKLQVSDRVQAAVWAAHQGLVQPL